METVATASGAPRITPSPAPMISATHISSLVSPRRTAGSRLRRSGRKVSVPSGRVAGASDMVTSQDRRGFGEKPQDHYHQQRADADHGAEVLPGLALVLHVGVDGQRMPGHAEEGEGGDQQAEQDAAVVGIVLDGVDQPRTFTAGGRSMVGRSAQASVELSSTWPPNRPREQDSRNRPSGRWQRRERFMASSPDYDSMKNINTITARARRSVLPPSAPKLRLPAAQPR